MIKVLILFWLLGSSICEDEKGKRFKAFAVPATVSTLILNAQPLSVLLYGKVY